MKKKAYEVYIGRGHIFIMAENHEFARKRAIEIVFDIKMPKKVLWETNEQRIKYENTSAYEIEFDKYFSR